MNIAYRSPAVQFRLLDVGDPFSYQGTVYMKTSTVVPRGADRDMDDKFQLNAVNVTNGIVVGFVDSDEVHLVYGEFVMTISPPVNDV